uniref:Uncharacterized protein n=1 Tax=Parascaris univalens TaxID=6257 RepID=A0A915B613_PARUN
MVNRISIENVLFSEMEYRRLFPQEERVQRRSMEALQRLSKAMEEIPANATTSTASGNTRLAVEKSITQK